MKKNRPFGPGHPDYDNQLSLFSDHEPVAQGGPLSTFHCVICENSTHGEPMAGRCVQCGGDVFTEVKRGVIEGAWECLATRQIVTAKTLELAFKKLTKQARAVDRQQIVPATYKYGGYSLRKSAPELERKTS